MREVAEKVLKLVDCGLSRGLGVPEPGKMCVEAVVANALGEEHSDRPSCVAPVIAEFKARLNDGHWTDDMTRGAGMREIAVYQLGSKDLDEGQFARRVIDRISQEVVPPLLLQAHSVRLDQTDGSRIGALCAQLATQSFGDPAMQATLSELRRLLPLEKCGWFATQRGGADVNFGCIDLYDELAIAAYYYAQANWNKALYGMVSFVDILVNKLGEGETSLKQIARIGCDVLREMNSPGVAAWDEIVAAQS